MRGRKGRWVRWKGGERRDEGENEGKEKVVGCVGLLP